MTDRVVNLLDELSAPTTLSEARGLPENTGENPQGWKIGESLGINTINLSEVPS